MWVRSTRADSHCIRMTPTRESSTHWRSSRASTRTSSTRGASSIRRLRWSNRSEQHFFKIAVHCRCHHQRIFLYLMNAILYVTVSSSQYPFLCLLAWSSYVTEWWSWGTNVTRSTTRVALKEGPASTGAAWSMKNWYGSLKHFWHLPVCTDLL